MARNRQQPEPAKIINILKRLEWIRSKLPIQ
jgi:hypothetical protein